MSCKITQEHLVCCLGLILPEARQWCSHALDPRYDLRWFPALLSVTCASVPGRSLASVQEKGVLAIPISAIVHQGLVTIACRARYQVHGSRAGCLKYAQQSTEIFEQFGFRVQGSGFKVGVAVLSLFLCPL